MMVSTSIESLLSIGLVLIGIAAAIFLIFRFGQVLVKLVIGVVVNSILGFLVLFLLNFFLNLGITYSTGVLLSTAIFGLPAVGTIAILKIISGVPV